MSITKHTTGSLAIVAIMALSSCGSQYNVASITPRRYEMTSAYDPQGATPASEILAPYKEKIEQTMNTVIGRSAMYMSASRPQSLLSNFISDVLYDAADKGRGVIDFAVMNVGGIRATMPQGNVTVSNIYQISPFENSLAIVELKGEHVAELLADIARLGGEGLSRQVEMTITESGEVKSAKIGGQGINPAKTYKVATIDYLAEGNDKLYSFKKSVKVDRPEGALLRDIVIEYIKQKTREGKEITSKIDSRLTISK
ncbi:MAG: 5'-nucleotidase C-terminal domain-containing protein [Bacteroidaceae bacterium]|nr:5'-nucleotidase C-terminal domain-containing protein [Bacteroidaceae bacterium]